MPHISNQVSSPSVHWFQRRKYLKVFTIYWHGRQIGHVTWNNLNQFLSPSPRPSPRRLYIKFGYKWASDFWGDVNNIIVAVQTFKLILSWIFLKLGSADDKILWFFFLKLEKNDRDRASGNSYFRPRVDGRWRMTDKAYIIMFWLVRSLGIKDFIKGKK